MACLIVINLLIPKITSQRTGKYSCNALPIELPLESGKDLNLHLFIGIEVTTLYTTGFIQ
ncbi:hypothetical protein M0R04_05475 [Candidatus Dojkabacteria bacterium]|nr:hypothetical protein [Candidatus Dojkabacteria bacterium]